MARSHLINSTVSNNNTNGDFSYGGGIYSRGDVTVTNSTVSGNSTTGYAGQGGGILARRSVTLTRSTVSDNFTKTKYAFGGGIFATNNVTLTDSTVSGNRTEGTSGAFGGGIGALQKVMLTNSTVSGNSTAGINSDGGGIWVADDLSIYCSTVTDNHADASIGGGIWKSSDPSTIDNSIIAGNTAGGGSPDLNAGTGTLIVNYSLIGDNEGTGLTESQTQDPVTGKIVGDSQGSGIVDPLLGPLTSIGGPTQTHASQPGSPVIDMGDPGFDPNVFNPPLVNDQRGAPFARVFGDRIDIGAVEDQPTPDSADFDTDGDIDGADFLAWQRGFGTPGANKSDGDANNDNNVDATDLGIWEGQFGSTGGSVVATSSASVESVAGASRQTADLFDAALVLALRESASASAFGELALEEENLLPATRAEAVLALSDTTPSASSSANFAPSVTRSNPTEDQEEDRIPAAIVDEAFADVFG